MLHCIMLEKLSVRMHEYSGPRAHMFVLSPAGMAEQVDAKIQIWGREGGWWHGEIKTGLQAVSVRVMSRIEATLFQV